MPNQTARSVARWTARIMCTLFFLVMQPLYMGRGRPKWELLTWFETFTLIVIAVLLACCVMAWFWPRLAGWLMLANLVPLYAAMLYELGKLELWFVGIMLVPALLLIYAGRTKNEAPD